MRQCPQNQFCILPPFSQDLDSQSDSLPRPPYSLSCHLCPHHYHLHTQTPEDWPGTSNTKAEAKKEKLGAARSLKGLVSNSLSGGTSWSGEVLVTPEHCQGDILGTSKKILPGRASGQPEQ